MPVCARWLCPTAATPPRCCAAAWAGSAAAGVRHDAVSGTATGALRSDDGNSTQSRSARTLCCPDGGAPTISTSAASTATPAHLRRKGARARRHIPDVTGAAGAQRLSDESLGAKVRLPSAERRGRVSISA
jgi:hypothetical protein